MTTFDERSMGEDETLKRAGRPEPVSQGERTTLRPGDQPVLGRIDRYELIEELGGGGFGVVYRARDVEAGIEVAVKGLPPLVQQNREELDRVRENFALVSRLHHPHIAAPLHLHRAQSVWYTSEDVKKKLRVLEDDYLFVMSYAPGVTLSKWRRQFPNGKVPVDQALDVCRQIAEALDYAHSQKVMHRDIKPSNVVIETRVEGRGSGDAGKVVARVLDFGLAAEIRSSMSRVSKESGDTSGTRPYMAPEQWAGKKQGPATDQYALAVLFYELVGGEVPFAPAFETGDSAIMERAIVSREPEPLPELNKAQNTALMRGLAKDATERFGSCAEFVEELGGGEGRGSRVGGRRGKRGKRGEGRGAGVRRVLAWAAGLMLLAAGAYWSYTSYQSHQEDQARVAAEQTEEARRDAEAQARLDNLRRDFDAALQQGQLEAAGSSLADFERLGGSRTAVTEMQRRYDATAGAQEVRRRAVAAQLARQDADAVADGPGMAERKREIERLWLIAERAEVAQDWADAQRGYDAVLAEVRILQQADTARNGAEQARRAAQTAEDSARSAGAHNDAASRFGDAGKEAERARDLFNAADFASASSTWKSAQEKFQGSETWARSVQAYQKARADYEAALTGVDSSLLQQYAAADWREARTQAGVGERSADQPGAGREAYLSALAALNKAKAEAQRRATPSLVFDVSAGGQNVRGKISEGTRSYTAGETIPLERGRSYTFRVSYDDPSGKRWSTAEVRKTAGWLGEQRETVRLEEITEPRLGDTERVDLGNNVYLELVWIPATTSEDWKRISGGKTSFTMGSPANEPGQGDREGPQHEVTISRGFWMGKYPVTQRQYQQLIGENPAHFQNAGPNAPVERVTWHMATNFTARLQGRLSGDLRGKQAGLPTEAEWEYACRAGTTTPFFFGRCLSTDQANYDGNHPLEGCAKGEYRRTTTRVDLFPANAWGLHDMHGNVWEWCQDGFRTYSASAVTDPGLNDISGSSARVLRGGSWFFVAGFCRSAFRLFYAPGFQISTVGFRVVVR